MRIKRSPPARTTIIDITSLVDVMFILIIFFLATSVMASEERDLTVNLPHTSNNDSLSTASRTLVINVRKSGEYYVLDGTHTLEQVRGIIQAALKADPDQRVLVRGDREALHGNVAALMSLCKAEGVKNTNLGYEYRVNE